MKPRILNTARLSLPLATALAALLASPSVQAGNTWDGGGADDNWGTANNWNPDGAPTPGSANDLFFGGTTRLTSNNNYTAFDDWRNIIFNVGAGAFTLTGNSIDLFGKIENLSTNTQTVNFTSIALNSASANEFNPVNGNLTIGSNVITNGNQLKVYGNNGFTLTFGTGSDISGLGSLAINQNSNVVFQSAHTYSGDTFINAGSLQFAQGGSANNSTIRIGDNAITNSPAASITISDADGGTTISSTLNVRASFGGTVGTRTISGTNTSGTNTFSGAVALDQVATVTSANSGGTLAFTGATLELKTFGLLVNGSGNTTISNLISSTGAGNQLTKSGSGTLTLTGPNSYDGANTINGGTLDLGGSTANGSLASTVLNLGGGTFSYTRTGNTTQAFTTTNINGGGASAITAVAGNTLTLGSLLRTAGTVNIGTTGTITTTTTNTNSILGPWASFGSGTSTRYATGGGTIAGLTGTAAATAANVTDTGGTFNYDVAAVGTLGAGANINTLRYTGAAGTIAGALTTKGIMNVGGGTLTFSGTVSGGGELVVNTANGDVSFSSVLTSGTTALVKAGPGRLTLPNSAPTFTGAVTVNGGVLQYGDNLSWLTTGNITLNGGVIEQRWTATNTLVQGSGAGQIQILGGESGFSENGATGLTWNIGAVTWGSATFNPSKFVLQTAASQSGSNITFSSNIDLNGANRTVLANTGVAANAASTLSGIISNGTGTAGLIKEGTGYLALSNTNTYNGQTIISAGMLDATTFANVNTNSSIGKGSGGGSAADLVINGGTLRHSAANVATTNRLFSIGTSGGIIDSSAASATNLLNFNGSGAMGFNSQLGTRTLTLTGTNTGNNNMGVLIGNDGSANATSVTKTGAGLWILSNASNSYTGPTTITAGTLSVGVAGNLGNAASNLVFNGGTLQITGTGLTNFASLGRTNPVTFTSGQTVGLDINNAGNVFTVDQTLNQGTGGLTKAGAGTLLINSAHTYTGVTTISAGTLRLDSGGSLAGSSMINNALFLVNQNATVGTAPLANIAGSGSIAAGPSATITINTPTGLQFNGLDTTGGGSFALSGVTTPTFGGLSGTTGNLSSAFSSGYSGVTSLTLNTAANNIAGNSFTYGGVINDGATGMSLTKTGAGTQTLTGNNTYTGTTFLNGGTLAVGTLSTIGKLSGTTDLNFNGGTLQFNRSTNADINAINNAATITVNASSTFGVTSGDAGGVSANETVGAVTLNAGQMNFNWTNGASSGAQMILTSLSRSGTASAAFNGVLGTTGRWKVNGAGSTTAGQIIGPWYTTGGANAGFASTDYAVFGSDFIAAANIAGSAETTWTNSANAYTTSAGGTVTLTGTRTITALRNTGATTVLTLASGANLETSGLLNGVATLLTVAPGTGGVLTTSGGGGNLYVNAGAGAITVSAPINGTLTLVKNGSNTLTLTSTTSNFSGGVVLNAGTLSIDDVRSIGGTNNTGGSTAPITVNGSSTISMPTNNLVANFGTGAVTIANGATLTVSSASRGDLRFGGAVTGSGGVTATSGSFWAKYSFTSTANDFTGAITDSRSGNDGIANALFSFNSISNVAGAGNIILNGATDSGIDYGSGATAALVMDYRQLVLAANNTVFFNNASSQAVNINTDIGFSGTGARQIRFGITGRSGAGVSTFAGKLTDNVGGAFSPTFNGGTWVASNNNNYTGTTSVNGTAIVTMSGNNTLTGGITVSGSTGATLTLSGNNSGMTGGVVLSTATGTVASSPKLNINSATALGTGILNFGGGAATDVVQIDNTSLSAVNVSTANAITMNRNFTFVGTRNLSLGTGTTTLGGMTSGTNRSITVTANTLTLGGTIAEAAANLGINKAGAGTLVLSGTGSTYTGATVVTAGTLAGIGANSFGSTSGISVAAASTATLSLRGDSSTNFVKTSDSSLYSVTTTANGATINVDQATIAGTGAKTMTIGTLALNNAVTNGTNFTGANNTSLSIGAVTTAAAASGTETLTNNISGGGSLTLASLAVTRTGTPTVLFNGTGNTTVTGNITQVATTKLTKDGAGVLTLTGTNTYTGATTLTNGTLSVATIGNGGFASGNLGSATNAAANIVFDGGTLKYTGANATSDRAFTINTGKTATIDTDNDISFAGATGAATNGALTKTGGGTLTLSGTNTYTGATAVNAGKLLVLGSIGGSTIMVNNAGTILATDAAASFGSTVGISTGAILAPGDASAAGTATVTGATTFADASIFSWDINSTGTSYDKLVSSSLVDGDTAGAAVFRIVASDVTFADTFWDTTQTWTNIFTTDGSAPIANWADIFTSVTVVNSSFATITPVGGSFSASGNTLTWTAVPEPTSALVGLLVGAGLLRRRRSA